MTEEKITQVIVGIDSSSESMHAASIGAYIARRSKAEYQLVHATKDLWVSARRVVTAAASSISASTTPANDAEMVEAAHANLAADLANDLPDGVSREIQVESGRAGPVLRRVAKATDADLIVIGGKHHSTFGRWLGGSTAHYLARNASCPVLVTADQAKTFSRVLVAVDLSDHSRAVLKAGEKLAIAVHAAMKVVHIVEGPPGDQVERLRERTKKAETAVTKLIQEIAHGGTESTVVPGELWPSIQAQINSWDADALVVGSHGSGYESQQLLGRLCEECLDDLPTSTLIVPFQKPN